MRVWMSVLAVAVMAGCATPTAPTPGLVSSVSSFDVKPGSVVQTFGVYAGRGVGSCNIDGWRCGAEVTVTAGALSVSGTTSQPNGRVAIPTVAGRVTISVRDRGKLCVVQEATMTVPVPSWVRLHVSGC